MTRLLWAAAAFAVLVCSASSTPAQQVLIDQAVRAEGLWCFPSAVNPDHYYYIPQEARLVTGPQGQPEFSFLRYVINNLSAQQEGSGITDAEGGGILHMLATYDTPEQLRDRAEKRLRQIAGDRASEEIQLRGPVIFKEGRYALISSIINPGGVAEPRLLAVGNAPVLEGNQIALSFDLEPERATLLLESLKMETPDISLVFEMVIEGVADAFDAQLTIKWDDVYKHRSFQAGGSMIIPVYGGATVGVGGTVGATFNELMQNKSIELKTRGSNEQMEGLLERVHGQLLDLLFEPVTPPPSRRDDTAAGLKNLLNLANTNKEEKAEKDLKAQQAKDTEGGGEKSSGAPSSYSLTASYKTKEIRRSGITTMDLNSQLPVQRTTTIGFNIGDIFQRLGGDERFFKTVNLADPAFQQREIHVGIDGAILPEFDAYINSVTALLRKRHENGDTTLQEVVIDRDTFKRENRDFRMIYGWSGDDDRTDWLNYQYRTRWSFKGGGVYETDWKETSANMIDLYAPYRRKVLQVIGDTEFLQEQGIRAVIVQVEYPFFDGTKKQQVRLKTSEPLDSQPIEITLPLEATEWTYKITWLGTGKRLEQSGTDRTGLIFIDEPPGEQAIGMGDGA